MSAATATKPRPPKAEAPPAAMKLTLNRGEFLRALSHAAAIVEERNTIPVLANVLLEATRQELRLTSTDLNIQIALTVPANVEAEGATTVSAALLYGIVREFADGSQVELKLDESRLQVNSGRSRYKLQTLPRDQFPVLKLQDTVAEIELPAPDLLATFRKVEFAQSTEETRYYLNGVHIDVADGELVFAACDGNLLAWSKLSTPDGVEALDVILPTKAVATLGKLLDGHDGPVKLTFEQSKVIAEVDGSTLVSKLVDGTFPQWRRVIPANNGKRLIVGGASLTDAVRRASLIANERTRLVKVELSTDKLTVSCTSPENGVAVEEAPCAWNGDAMTVGMNSRQLALAIAALGGDEVHIDFGDEATPVLISNPDDDSAHAVVTLWRV